METHIFLNYGHLCTCQKYKRQPEKKKEKEEVGHTSAFLFQIRIKQNKVAEDGCFISGR